MALDCYIVIYIGPSLMSLDSLQLHFDSQFYLILDFFVLSHYNTRVCEIRHLRRIAFASTRGLQLRPFKIRLADSCVINGSHNFWHHLLSQLNTFVDKQFGTETILCTGCSYLVPSAVAVIRTLGQSGNVVEEQPFIRCRNSTTERDVMTEPVLVTDTRDQRMRSA